MACWHISFSTKMLDESGNNIVSQVLGLISGTNERVEQPQ